MGRHLPAVTPRERLGLIERDAAELREPAGVKRVARPGRELRSHGRLLSTGTAWSNLLETREIRHEFRDRILEPGTTKALLAKTIRSCVNTVL